MSAANPTRPPTHRCGSPLREPTARSLTLDLLATLRGDAAMPVKALVEAGELFGLAANNMRVSLARLLAAAAVERDQRGRYRLGPRTAATGRHVAAWRRAEESLAEWSGDWWAAHQPRRPSAARTAVRREERTLHRFGLRRLEAGLWVRPANLRAPLDEFRSELDGLGLLPDTVMFSGVALDTRHRESALHLWDADRLVDTYRTLTKELEASAARLPGMGEGEAMVESFRIGGRVLRHVVADPRLPAPIVPRNSLRALVEAMRRYDRLGRSCWAPFLERHGVPHRDRAPVDFQTQPRARTQPPAERVPTPLETT